MNKRTVMASLNKIANELDNNGLHNEADTVTKVMSRLAYEGYDKIKHKLRYDTSQTEECPDCGELLFDGECDECGYGHGEDDEDYDMGPEKEPFDYSSPVDEDEGNMYGDDMEGYDDNNSDF